VLPIWAGLLLAGTRTPAALLAFLGVCLVLLWPALHLVVSLAGAAFARKHLCFESAADGGRASMTASFPVGRFAEMLSTVNRRGFWLAYAGSFLLIGLPLLLSGVWLIHARVGPGGLLFGAPRVLEGRVLAHAGFWTPGPTEKVPKLFQAYLREGLEPAGTMAASAGRAICGFPAESEETRPADPPVRGSAAYQEWLAAALAWARGSRHIVGEVTLGLGRAQGVRQGALFHVIGRGRGKAPGQVPAPPSESECRAVPLTLVPFQPVLPGDLALRIGE